MSETFDLKVLTPMGALKTATVTSVTLPTSDGQIGVLPDHVRYAGVLGTGILEYIPRGAAAPEKMVVSGGTVSFVDNELTVLTDTADLPQSVDRAALAKARPTLQQTIETSSTFDPAWLRAKQQLDRIDAVDQLAPR